MNLGFIVNLNEFTPSSAHIFYTLNKYVTPLGVGSDVLTGFDTLDYIYRFVEN